MAHYDNSEHANTQIHICTHIHRGTWCCDNSPHWEAICNPFRHGYWREPTCKHKTLLHTKTTALCTFQHTCTTHTQTHTHTNTCTYTCTHTHVRAQTNRHEYTASPISGMTSCVWNAQNASPTRPKPVCTWWEGRGRGREEWRPHLMKSIT